MELAHVEVALVESAQVEAVRVEAAPSTLFCLIDSRSVWMISRVVTLLAPCIEALETNNWSQPPTHQITGLVFGWSAASRRRERQLRRRDPAAGTFDVDFGGVAHSLSAYCTGCSPANRSGFPIHQCSFFC